MDKFRLTHFVAFSSLVFCFDQNSAVFVDKNSFPRLDERQSSQHFRKKQYSLYEFDDFNEDFLASDLFGGAFNFYQSQYINLRPKFDINTKTNIESVNHNQHKNEKVVAFQNIDYKYVKVISSILQVLEATPDLATEIYKCLQYNAVFKNDLLYAQLKTNISGIVTKSIDSAKTDTSDSK